LLCAALLAAVGCVPRDADIRRERLAAERRNLEETFDRLEERMVANQARVRFWREMRARHESVSAIACASQDEHAEEMASRALPEERRRVVARRASLDGSRVAAVRPAAADSVKNAPATMPGPSAR
jgi:hypothetical protein